MKKKGRAETAPLLHAAGAIGYTFAYVIHDAYMSEAHAKAEGDRLDHGESRTSQYQRRSADHRTAARVMVVGSDNFSARRFLNVVSSPEVGSDRQLRQVVAIGLGRSACAGAVIFTPRPSCPYAA